MKKKYFLYSLLVIAFLFSTALSVGAFFISRNANKEEITSEEVFAASLYSVVELKAETEDVGESFGTAEFVSNDGTLITNAHVVTYKTLGVVNAFENISIRFAFENDYRLVSLIKYDTDLDIAVLKLNDLNCKFKPISLGDSSKLKNGNIVYAIGNLNNVGISITSGMISNSNITVTYNEVTREVIQCDLTIAEGNSGGALLDKNGNLIGITTFRLKDTDGKVIYGISYCIPINTVLEYIEK